MGFGGVGLLREPRRTGPLAVEATLGGTADLALRAGLECVGREGDEDERRFAFWGDVLVAVVAMIYRRRGVCWYRSDRPDPQVRSDLPAKKRGKGRDDVLDHVQSGATDRGSISRWQHLCHDHRR